MDAPTRSLFDVVTDFLANRPSDEDLLAYEIPLDLQARLEALVEIDKTSRLTAAQRDELGDFRFVQDVMQGVKVRIRRRLAQENSEDGDAPAAASDSENEEKKS